MKDLKDIDFSFPKDKKIEEVPFNEVYLEIPCKYCIIWQLYGKYGSLNMNQNETESTQFDGTTIISIKDYVKNFINKYNN